MVSHITKSISMDPIDSVIMDVGLYMQMIPVIIFLKYKTLNLYCSKIQALI